VEIPITADTQAKLSRIAAARGSDPKSLAQEAIERFVDHDEWFLREVEKGLTSAGNSTLLSHEEVGVRLEARIARNQSRH
jgi:predicted transcriptional regulator